MAREQTRIENVGILLSGGIDSTAIAYWKRPGYAFTIDYGQVSAAGEIRSSRKIASILGLHHEIITVNCRALGSGDLAGGEPAKDAPASEWWPYRNQMLITLAAMRAFSLGIKSLLVGSVKGDGFHQDGKPEFYQKISELLVMQEGSMEVQVPAISLTSTELVNISGLPFNLLSWTHSCHKSDMACGQCRGCNKHREVRSELGYEL